jgi:ectoine hydroxylase
MKSLVQVSSLDGKEVAKAKENFKDKGYHLFKGMFSADDCRSAATWLRSKNLASLAKTFTDQEPGVDLAVYQGIQFQNEGPLVELVKDKEMLNFASTLIGSEIYVWSSKVNLKAAWCGTAEYYHQDYVYWKDRGYKTSEMLTCMIFLDQHGIKNGGLHVFPGSHKKGFIEHQPFINVNGLQKYMIPPQTLNSLNCELGLECIEAQPGDVLFFHTELVHGSAHNISGEPRMILLAQLNSHTNKPTDVAEKAREFNLRRAKFEVDAAFERFEYFKKKYEAQMQSKDLLFNSPIPTEERY